MKISLFQYLCRTSLKNHHFTIFLLTCRFAGCCVRREPTRGPHPSWRGSRSCRGGSVARRDTRKRRSPRAREWCVRAFRRKRIHSCVDVLPSSLAVPRLMCRVWLNPSGLVLGAPPADDRRAPVDRARAAIAVNTVVVVVASLDSTGNRTRARRKRPGSLTRPPVPSPPVPARENPTQARVAANRAAMARLEEMANTERAHREILREAAGGEHEVDDDDSYSRVGRHCVLRA